MRVELWPLNGCCSSAGHDGRERLEGKVMKVGTESLYSMWEGGLDIYTLEEFNQLDAEPRGHTGWSAKGINLTPRQTPCLIWGLPIWGLFSGLQNVPSPILSSVQKGFNSTNKCWTWADTKPQQHTDLHGESFHTAQWGYLNILGMRRNWSWRCLVVLEKHVRPYFTKYLYFSFYFI